MYVVQSSPTLLSVTGIEWEYLLQQKKGGERHDVEPEDKSRVQCFSFGWRKGLAESMRKGFLETDTALLKSAEILLQAAVRGGLIDSLICCALQYFSNRDLFRLSKSCYCFGFANKYGNSILFIYLFISVKLVKH